MAWRQLVLFATLVFLSAGIGGHVLTAGAAPIGVWTAAGLTTLIAIVLVHDIRRRHQRTLREAEQALRRMTDDEFGLEVYASGEGVSELARAVNAAGESLSLRISRLEDECRQLRAVLSGMVEGVVSLDAQQRILFANERAAQLLDFHSRQAVGRRFWEVVRHRRLQEMVRIALTGSKPIRDELDWTGPIVRRLALYAARQSRGTEEGVVLVLHDTTELRRLEQVRQEFVANVSHELKTPLSVIKVCVETLLDADADNPKDRTRFLEEIDEQANRLHALILDLLSLARIESGAAALEFQSVSLDRAAEDCLERHRQRAHTKGQSLITPPQSDEPHTNVRADAEALDTILDNLVDNAIKYTPKGGQICIGWHSEGNEVCLTVGDTGVGIPEPDLPRIFERFYRVDKARARELGGTGLGLAIVKHLVQSMQGSVSVASTVGRGTVVTVKLPAG